MEINYELELNNHELYQFLRRNGGCRVYWPSDSGEYCATFTSNSRSVYFWNPNGTYNSTDMSTESYRKHNSKYLLERMNNIIRVEKEFEGQWKPVWTAVDGFIDTDYQTFAYIGERYYTFNELKQIIEEVKSLKSKVSSLKVY